MQITIERRGGFAGLEEHLATVDVDTLPKPVADQLRERVAQLATLTAQSPTPVGADQFLYEIGIVEPGAQPRILTVVDEGDPEQPLMKQVRAILDLVAGKP
jgi:hypothetical protein